MNHYDEPTDDELRDRQAWTDILKNAAIDAAMLLCLFAMVGLVAMGTGYVYGTH